MKKHLSKLVATFTVALSLSQFAQTPTWAKDIAPIMYKNCTSCHHAGGLAPMPLMTYTQAFNYKTMIKSYVDSKLMPPWPPDAEYRHLAFERILGPQDKDRISQWVLGGAPEGNPGDAPTPPTYTNTGTELSSINFSAKMNTYTVNTNIDLYRCFVVPTNFSADKFAAEIEVKPGNSAIVHHVLVFEDTAQTIINMDNADPGEGYTSFFGTGSSTSRLIGEWVPGTAPIKFPTMMGIRLKKNTRLILQIHYPKGTFVQTDSTRINIKFAVNTTSPLFREVWLLPLVTESNLLNGPLSIPPNVLKTFTAQATATVNGVTTPFNAFTLLSIAPHMHLIGKQMKVFSIDKITADTVPLINIPKWDFKWQGIYSYRNPLKITEGSTVIVQSAYDNTSSNPSNPNSPPVQVNQGESTSDEMMLVFAAMTYYFNGDENIIVDNSPLASVKELQDKSIVNTLQLYSVYPNPAKNQGQINYYAPEKLNGKAKILSAEGKVVKEWPVTMEQGFGSLQLSVEGLSKGQYFINIETKSYIKTRSFVVHE
jgi:hypothetical protein